MKKVFLKILRIFIALISIVVVGFYLWAVLPYTVMDEAESAMISDDNVEVLDNEHIFFKPTEKLKEKLYAEGKSGYLNKGLIVYPGTRVDSEAYSPMARAIAEKGYTVALAQMPLDLSVLNIKATDNIIKNEADIETWVISGHSMGGAMAAFYTADHLELIDGLVFLGSYPGESTDLSDSDIEVLSIYGEYDLVASEEEVNEKRPNLPDDTIYVEIEGGNHAQFGWYGEQSGDGQATISYEEQKNVIVEEILNFMDMLD